MRRGAVLAIVAVLGGVLAILATAVFVIFNANLSSWEYRSGRVRAQLAAEAGVSLALHTLENGSEAPTGEPFPLPGDSAHWIGLPGGDRVWVVLDPCDRNGLPMENGSVEIRARGWSGETWRDVAVRAVPDYPSRYSILTDRSIPRGIVYDGLRFDGSVHSNGEVHLASASPDSTDDPLMAEVSTTSEGGFVFEDAGRSSLPHPEGSRVWIRPYALHRQGRPFWDAAADSVDFERLADLFSGLQAQASAGGTILPGARRMLLDGNRIITARDAGVPGDTIWLQEVDLVYVAGSAPVLLKSVLPLTTPLTLVCAGPVGLMGPVQAGSAGSGSPVAIVSLSNIYIARDPGLYGQEDWPAPWDIQTDRHLAIQATLCAPRGVLSAEDPVACGNSYSFIVMGGLTAARIGMLGSPGSGYSLATAWDAGLQTIHPPHFPSLERWRPYSWAIDPDYGGRSIDENMF